MTEMALIYINGGRWDGNIYEIQLDPSTNSPPQFFSISDDGLVLLSQDGLTEIGRLYSGSTETLPTVEFTETHEENGH